MESRDKIMLQCIREVKREEVFLRGFDLRGTMF